MKVNKTKIKRILLIGLSNIGDAILTTPVVETLRRHFPQAHLALLIGPRAFCVFKHDRRIDRKIIYDKAICRKNKLGLINRLRQDRYDLVVDLRYTAFSMFLGARYHTWAFAKPPRGLTHMLDRHLWKLKSLGLNIDNRTGLSVEFTEDERDNVKQMFKRWQIKDTQTVIAVAPGARNMTKCWERQGYKELIERLTKQCRAKIIMVGDDQDKLLIDEISGQIKPVPLNASGKTSIGELALVLVKCRLLVSNDSAPMHLASAVNTPLISIFGPTDYRKYAPRGPQDILIRKELDCSPCEQSLCPKGTRECMKMISADEVFAACKKILDEKL
ncbi:MAG: glycosyltransferase family 9 protein [Omnitrophica bacterium]|nr:glycosyltransferase family 9 protein [Candidatus Omnitrophota bacterium]